MMVWSRFHFASAAVNEILGSLAVGGYTLPILLLTFLRPRTLFYALVSLLLLVVPVEMVMLPLSAISQGPIKTEHIEGNLYFDKIPWDADALGSSGTTLSIYEKAAVIPFVRHDLQRVVFDDAKCLSEKALVVLQPDRRHALARCPWPQYEHRRASTTSSFRSSKSLRF